MFNLHPICCESPIIVFIGEDEQKLMENRWVNESYEEVGSPDSFTIKNGAHVVSNKCKRKDKIA